MRKIFILSGIFFLSISGNHLSAQNYLDRLKQRAKEKLNQRADRKTDEAMDKGLDDVEASAKKKKAKEEADKKAANTSNQTPGTSPATNTSTPTSTDAGGSMKIYNNYDFIPGDTVLFEDHFTDDADGEFPSHWQLSKGQAVLNTSNNEKSLNLTDGNYAVVYPLMSKPSYLGNQFTIEFDYYMKAESYGLILFFEATSDKDDLGKIQFRTGSAGSVSCSFPEEKYLTGEVSGADENNFLNKWHHVAIAYKNGQIKIYVDQARALVVPNSNMHPGAVEFGGIASNENPLTFKNVRIARGGKMNMLGKKFTDTKIITHGINFDYNLATIKPESMGTLNMIMQILKDNPELKFEVGGYTDADGADDYNTKLSQQRADAVRSQLINMGIKDKRLTSKGYGKSKPISDNLTPEGKANNRRVEFVKI
jgi:OOP family OmpA-OmpF porin